MAQQIFACLATELSKLYDEFLEYMPIKKERSYDIAAINSNFLISIDFYEVNILIHDNDNYFKEIFKLTWPNYSNEYRYDECNSSLVLSTLQGREEELFKKIFVRISNCPNWCQPILYEIRKKELEERQAEEYNKNDKEGNDQKGAKDTKGIIQFFKKFFKK